MPPVCGADQLGNGSASHASASAVDVVDERLLKHRDVLQSCEVDGWKRFDDVLFKINAGSLALSVTPLGVLRVPREVVTGAIASAAERVRNRALSESRRLVE